MIVVAQVLVILWPKICSKIPILSKLRVRPHIGSKPKKVRKQAICGHKRTSRRFETFMCGHSEIAGGAEPAAVVDTTARRSSGSMNPGKMWSLIACVYT